MRTGVVVGNPKPASRTLLAADKVATGLSGGAVDLSIDLVELGPRLLGIGDDDDVAALVAEVAACHLVVFASPTFKATYTGLLKLFLEQFAGQTGLAGVLGVPLMLGAAPQHALAPDLLLKPVLAELGATCALPGLFLIDRTFASDSAVPDYCARWRPTVGLLCNSQVTP